MKQSNASSVEAYFIENSNLNAHRAQVTTGKPLIHAQLFCKVLESCASFLADWATWQIQRRRSHQSMLLARSFRTHWLNPLQDSFLRLAHCEVVEKYQSESDEWREAMPYLFHVLHTCIPRSSSTREGFIVYNTLYRELARVPDDSLAYKILISTWRDLLHVLANQVRRAIIDGHIDDVYSEFFIEERPQTEQDKQNDVYLPFQRYRVVKDRLPSFVSAMAAENVLFAVHAIDCNSIIRDANRTSNTSRSDLERASASAQEIDNAFERMAICPVQSSLILDAVSLQWRKNAASALSDILPVAEIRSGLATIRAYLLLGDELFWRAFFDELRQHHSIFKEEDLTEQEKTRAERILNNILGSVYADNVGCIHGALSDAKLNSSRGDAVFPLTLKITNSGSVVPQYSLNDTVSILLARATPVYCDVFSIAFSVRRVGCELQKCFQILMLLSRKYQRKHVDRNVYKVNKRQIQFLSLLRLRMAIVIGALEFYVQCTVVQPQYEKLDEILKVSCTEKCEKSSSCGGVSLFDGFSSAQDVSVKILTEQCLLRNDKVVKRYEHIFSSCLSFCSSVQGLVNDKLWTLEMCVHSATNAETVFSRNVSLLSKLLEKTNASCFDSTVCELQRKLEDIARFAS